MSSRSKPDGERLTVRELCILSLLGAFIFATKFALAGLPNVNLNTLLIILCVVFFGWKTLYAVFIYVMLEGLVFGFSLWWFSYLYAWPAVTALAMLFRKNRSALVWAAFAGIIGLVFGPVMYVLYLFVTGWETAFALWVAGIPYDLIHCGSNFVLTLLLYKPLYKVFQRYLPERTGSQEEPADPDENPMT